MAKSGKARGRPKGSGIDDQPALEKIILLMAEDSDLKPTTAIKKLGITNSSTIRRLRDKLKAGEPKKVQAKRTRSSKPKASRATSAKSQTGSAKRSKEPRYAKEPHVPGPNASSSWPGTEWPCKGSSPELFPWMEVATRFALLAAQSQLALAQSVMRHPSMPFVIEQQAKAMNSMMELYFAMPFDHRRTDETSE